MSGQFIAKELKEEIIGKIKAEGISAAEAGRRYGVNVTNIYRWLSQGVDGAESRRKKEYKRKTQKF